MQNTLAVTVIGQKKEAVAGKWTRNLKVIKQERSQHNCVIVGL